MKIIIIPFILQLINSGKKVGLFFVFFITLAAIFSSCVRNTIEYEVPEGIAGLNIPSDFNWSNVNSVELTVIPSDVYNGDYFYVIEVFDGNPVIDSSAVLLAKGVAKKNHNYVAKFVAPVSSDRIYVRQINPLKLETVQSVSLVDNNLECDFNVTQSGSSQISERNLKSTAALSANETPENAVVLNSNTGFSLTLQKNTSYLIPNGVSYTGKITFSEGSSLYIDGALMVSSTSEFQMANSSKLVVHSDGVVNAGTSDMNFWSGEILNYGNITLGKLDINSSFTITNYSGSISFLSKLITRNNTNVILNYATMSIAGVELTNGIIDNKGYLTITEKMKANGATVTNSASMFTEDIESVNSVFNADCNIEVLGDFEDESGSTINIKEGSRFKSIGFDGSGTKVNFESASILDVTHVTFSSNQSVLKSTGNSYALARLVHVKSGNGNYECIYYKGNLEIENTSHYKGTNKWNVFYLTENSVRWSKTNASTTTIPSGSCNGGGNVVLPPGSIPSNPVFPISVPSASSYTFLMEDQWPSIGDYDMNDLVLGLAMSYSQNSENMVIEMTIETELRAIGAKKRIGAAMQLDELTSAAIQKVSYGDQSVITGKIFPVLSNGCESGQSKAVIPFFDDAHSAMDPTITSATTRMINTYNNQPVVSPKSNSIKITFATPVDPTLVSIMKMNFFIVSNGMENSTRRTEVHLSGFSPSDKNDWTKLGTGYDNSINGVNYTTPGNMIWGLLIPARFNYSAELINITDAYPQFSGWCMSGGMNYTDWYNNPLNEDGFIYAPK